MIRSFYHAWGDWWFDLFEAHWLTLLVTVVLVVFAPMLIERLRTWSKRRVRFSVF